MIEVSCFVIFDCRFLAGSVNQFWAKDVQALHCAPEFRRPSIVAQKYTVSVSGIVDVASGSHSVEQDIGVFPAACDDDIDCRDIFRLVP
jgi:hypothetical protein